MEVARDAHKQTGSKLRDTFARESSFDGRSEERDLGAEECYESFMRKQDQNGYQTKGLGFIPEMSRDQSPRNESGFER